MGRKKQKLFIAKCPACKDGSLRDAPLNGMAYCDKCPHSTQDLMRQDVIERDDPANLKFCNCDYCKRQEAT
jgi:hypothetical protein